MAYTLGFIYADGTIYTSVRGSYLVITNTDKPVIYNIKKWLGSKHAIAERLPLGNRKSQFILKIGNKKLYDSLVDIGLYPSKSLTIGIPEIPTKSLKDFARGYFDGDGCVFLWKSKGLKQEIILRKLSVIFTSGSKKFLDGFLQKLRNNISLKQDKIYTGHRSFQLRFATADSVALFKFLYTDTPQDLFLKRKFVVFKEYFSLRPQRVDKEIENILSSV